MARCAVCGRRKGKRPCPAKGLAVCTACCGENRSAEFGCPPDCVYLGDSARQVQIGSGPAHEGCYLIEEAGIRVAVLSAERNDDVFAGMFCVDDWRDGLFACHGRAFGNAAELYAAAARSPYSPGPLSRDGAREVVAFGARIRRETGRPMPEGYKQVRRLVEPLDEIDLHCTLFRCAMCGGDLEDHLIETIFESIQRDMGALMACDRCSRRKTKPEQETNVLVPRHMRVQDSFNELDRFDLTPDLTKYSALELDPAYHEAVEQLIDEGDTRLAACIAIESMLYYAAGPHLEMTDADALTAVEAARGARTPAGLDRGVRFLADSVKRGVNTFRDVHLTATGEPPRASVLDSALARISRSIRNHRSRRNPRAYLDFISRFIP